MKLRLIMICAMAALLNACAMNMKVAATPDEFRAMTGKERYYTLESFEVAENYNKVLKRVKDYSGECLAKEAFTGSANSSDIKSTWTPKLKAGKSRATMTLQKKTEGGIQLGPKAPTEDGFYMAVVDLKKLKGGKTQVEFRYMAFNYYKDFIFMFRDRIKGEGRGCPQTKMYL